MEETAELSRPEPPRPPLGKAFARLLEFEQARSAAGTDIGPTSNGKGAARRRSPRAQGALSSPGVAAAAAAVADEYASVRDGSGCGPRRYGLPMALARSHVHAERSDLRRIESRCRGQAERCRRGSFNAAHLLVGAAGGGVWESFDSGATWSPRTDGAPTLTVGAIAFDPAQPATVFVGTGEGNWYSRWGILKSDLLVINKTDLAPFVDVSIDLMIAEANQVRGGRPVMLTNCKTGEGVEAVVDRLVEDVIFAA